MSGENDWTFWLNVTNAALGLVVLGAILIVGFAMVREYLRAKAPQAAASGVDQELSALLREDSHHILIPELGLTMADGGEKRETSHNNSSGQK